MGSFETSDVDTIRKVDREELDLLVDEPTQTWGWLKTLEDYDVMEFEPRHIVVEDSLGMVGFSPCFLQRSGIFDDIGQELLLKWQVAVLDRLGSIGLPLIRLDPVLILGGSEGFSSRITTASRVKERREELLKAALDHLSEVADQDGRVFGLTAVSNTQQDLAALLASCGYRSSLRTANAVLDIKWRSFKEYLTSLRSRRRKAMKHEARSYARNGFTTRLLDDYEDSTEDLSRLAGKTHAHHSTKENPFTPHLYASLAKNLPGKAWVFSAEREGRMHGFVLVLEHKDIMVAHHCGSDYSPDTRAGHAYFNLLFHEPIRHAVRRGIRAIAYGPGEWDTKARRGCRFDKISVYLRSPRRLENTTLKYLLRYVDKKKNAWLDQRLRKWRVVPPSCTATCSTV